MSTPFPRERADPLSLAPFDDALLDAAVRQARESPRKRHIIRFHEHEDLLQRMLNAIEPESYTRPHRHSNPGKPEVFVALRGSALIVRYSDRGAPLEGVLISVSGPTRGVEIPAGAWHSLVSMEAGTVLFETKQGPYDPAADKEFAPWAPPEEDEEAGTAYIARLRAHFARLMPGVAAWDQIEAEDDDIC